MVIIHPFFIKININIKNISINNKFFNLFRKLYQVNPVIIKYALEQTNFTLMKSCTVWLILRILTNYSEYAKVYVQLSIIY